MIDLTCKALPNTVEVDGWAFPIETDFRAWLRFARCVENDDADIRFLFPGAVPTQTPRVYHALLEFYCNTNPCPHTESGSESIFSYDIDSEFVYAAFYQQYGIDLLTASLHWHQFKALFAGLTDSTKIVQIMDARSYGGSEKEQAAMRDAWALPHVLSEAEREKENAFDNYFNT